MAFFQSVRSALAKRSAGEVQTDEPLDHAVRQIIAGAVAPEGVVDIFEAAGLDKPDISILSEEFLAEVKGMKHRNVAVELLEKLLKGEISTRRNKNVVQARSFSEMLEESLRRYQNRSVEAAQVIEELIELPKEMREADERGDRLGLTDDEVAFYDAALIGGSRKTVKCTPGRYVLRRHSAQCPERAGPPGTEKRPVRTPVCWCEAGRHAGPKTGSALVSEAERARVTSLRTHA